MLKAIEEIKKRRDWAARQKELMLKQIMLCETEETKDAIRLAANYYHGEMIAFDEVLAYLILETPEKKQEDDHE